MLPRDGRDPPPGARATGSDFDGAITPPRDPAGADRYPRLVQCLLDRGGTDAQVAKLSGGNFLQAFASLRDT